jgi:ornithine decarboxylase
MISGGIPIYVPTVRNAWGLIGPMRWDALDEAALRERIRSHPLVEDPEAWRRPRPFRVAVVEQCTYDGTIHNAEMILQRIGHLCDYILFDEAWAGFMKFHPLYAGRFAMGLTGLGPDAPGIIATQSTHKQLASFSQASQIHMKDRHISGQKRRVEHRRFNESFMQHASTSPFYPLFASLDVGAQMMKGRSGEVLWDDTIRLGIELRKKIRTVRREFEAKEARPENRWFFEPFVPDRVRIPDVARGGGVHDVAWETVATGELATNPSYWQLAPDAAWHGFPGMQPGFAMTDPNKLTLLTPGFDPLTGSYAEHGIPAPVVAQYLRENRIVAEKNDLNSLLFLLTPGVEASKAGTLISGLIAFKKLHDDNALLEDAIPEFYRRRPARYAGVRLRDLCTDMHRFFREAGVSALQAKQFLPEHLPEIAMSPHAAARCLVRNDVDYLPIDAIAGRIVTTPFVVYPPGIATVVPGERLTERAQPMIDYLKMFETSFNVFPGFEVEIQGVYREVDASGRVRLHTYVVAE